MTSGAHDDGQLGEVFLKLGKQGSTLAGVMDAFSIAVSIGLQYGVPLETYVSKFTNLRFEPAGLTDDPDVRMAQSIMDYIFRRLALDYLSFEKRSALGIYSADERQRHLETGSYEPPIEETGSATELIEIAEVVHAEAAAGRGRRGGRQARQPKEAHTSAELLEKITGTAVDSPLCFTCGTKMRPAGSLLRVRGLRLAPAAAADVNGHGMSRLTQAAMSRSRSATSQIRSAWTFRRLRATTEQPMCWMPH